MMNKFMGVLCPNLNEESQEDLNKLDSNTIDWIIRTIIEFEDLSNEEKHKLIECSENLPTGLLFSKNEEKRKELQREIWRQYDYGTAFYVLQMFLIDLQKRVKHENI